MSFSANYPPFRPSLNLNFARAKVLDPRVTFTRASTGTYYDGVTTAKAEENLFIYSEQFNQSATWGPGAVTITADSTTAPNGATTADTLAGNGTSAIHYINFSSPASSVGKTVSIFAKANTESFLQINFAGDAAPWANFTLTAGSGAVGSSGTNQTASIVDAGNGWYRCILTTNSTAVTDVRFVLVDASTAPRFQSNTLATSIFIWGAQLEQRSSATSYTATTTQPITNYIPVLLTAANNAPRFDHNPTTAESLGLLIEESRTNLFTYSADYSLFPPWNKVRSSITSNTIVAPDGTLTGSKLVEDTTASNTHTIRQDFTLAIGTYTYSVFAKAGERTVLQGARSNTNIDTITHVFNLSTGVATGTGASMTPVGNGWYRCVGVITVNTAAAAGVLFALNDGSTTSYTGDGYSGLYLWGAQLEAGAFPTSYIATGAATATRSADAASMIGPNFSSWYRADEGTLYAEYLIPDMKQNQGAVAISDGTLNNRMIVRGGNSSLQTVFIGVKSTAAEWTASLSGAPVNSTTKSAFAYATNNIAWVRSAGTVGTDTSAIIPEVNQLRLGSDGDGSLILNGYLRRISYYPLRLTNAQLQALTS
jgi:hypothetical protein